MDRFLRPAAGLYAVGFFLHTADHFRRGIDSVTPQVFWLGNLSAVLAVGAIALVLAGHHLGPIAAVAVGLPVALGVSAVHLLPHWGVFSDPLLTGGLPPITWVAVLVEIGGAAVFGVSGLRAMRPSAA